MQATLKSLGVVILFLILSPAARSGGAVNNGMDQRSRNDDAAWFVGADRTIEGCLEISDGFGVGRDVAMKTVQHAFETWSRYFQEKGLVGILAARGLGLPTSIRIQEGCSGNEDLAFYFGVENELVRAARADFKRPLAFSERLSYDEKKRWGKGLIWLSAPATFGDTELDWTGGDRLLGALLHEIGHVYGCQHTEGTIMRAELADSILDRWADFTLNRIDSGRQLYLCESCAATYRMRLVNPTPLTELVGSPISLKAEGTLLLKADRIHLPNGVLTVKDGLKTYPIRARSISEIAGTFSDSLLFHVPQNTDGGQSEGRVTGFAARTRGAVYLLVLEYGGKSLTVAYSRNMKIGLSPTAGFLDELVLLDPPSDKPVLMILSPYP